MTKRSRTVRAAAFGLGFGVLAPLAACGDEGEEPDQDADVSDVTQAESDSDASDATAAEPDDDVEIFAYPERFVGDEVTVSGRVTRLVESPNAFALAGEGIGGEVLPVFSADGPEIDGDDSVEVTGTVREVVQESFEEDFGLPYDEAYDDLAGDHAIAAERIEVTDEAPRD